MSNKTILITGSSGMVGSRIISLLPYNFIKLKQTDVDITDSNAVESFLKKQHYDALWHLAAYTDVDGAEKNSEIAYRINVDGTRNLYIANGQKPFLYISTGFVFDGTTPPYTETSHPHPLSVYGKTKLAGEDAVRDTGAIVRIEYPFRPLWEGKKDFVARIRSLFQQGEKIRAIDNAAITPTYIDDVAQALAFLTEHYSPGIYHAVGNGSLSPFEACRAIAKEWKYDESLVEHISHEEFFSNRAMRPQYATLIPSPSLPKTLTFQEALHTLHSLETI